MLRLTAEAAPRPNFLPEPEIASKLGTLTTNHGIVLRNNPDPDSKYEALLVYDQDEWRFPGSAQTALQSGNPKLSASEQTYLETGLWVPNMFHLVEKGAEARFWSHHIDGGAMGQNTVNYLEHINPTASVEHVEDIGWFAIKELLWDKEKLSYYGQKILLHAARQRAEWDRQTGIR